MPCIHKARVPPKHVNELIEGVFTEAQLVADDFSYVMPGQRQRKRLVNVVDGFQAQRRDKSRAMP